MTRVMKQRKEKLKKNYFVTNKINDEKKKLRQSLKITAKLYIEEKREIRKVFHC